MITEIEAKLDVEIFKRTPKGMYPTPLGDTLIRHAKKLTFDIDQMAKEFSANQKGAEGSVRLGAVTGAALTVVIPAILQLKAQAPLVDASVDVSSSSQLMRGLEAGDYDFTLSRVGSYDYSRNFDIYPAKNEAIFLMVNRDHPFADKKMLKLKELSDQLWTVQDRGAPIRHAMEIAFHEEGLAFPRNIIETASVVGIMALLRDSNVIAVVTQEVVELLLSPPFSSDLVVLNIERTIAIEPYHVLRPRDRLMSQAAERLFRIVTEMLQR